MPSTKDTKHSIIETLKENEGSDRTDDAKEAVKEICFTLASDWGISIEEEDYK